jgi:undecaprenyl-diphosphatase
MRNEPTTGRFRAVLRRVGEREIGSVLALFSVAIGTLAFGKIASEVSEGDSQSLDRMVLLALRSPGDLSVPIGPRWLAEAARDITALGGWVVLALLTLASVGYLLLQRKLRHALFLAVAVIGAALLSLLLKDVFARPRPELVPHLVVVSSSSFPSGHSMLSTSVYLTLGAMLARLQSSSLVKAYLQLWALLLATLVGISRVYLGVHWPTDVLAGWAAGAAWATLCWVIARVLDPARSRRSSVA